MSNPSKNMPIATRLKTRRWNAETGSRSSLAPALTAAIGRLLRGVWRFRKFVARVRHGLQGRHHAGMGTRRMLVGQPGGQIGVMRLNRIDDRLVLQAGVAHL